MTISIDELIDRLTVINTDQCHFSKNLDEIKNTKIDTDVIKNILNTGYMYHKDMEAVNCMLESYIRMNNINESVDLITPEQIETIINDTGETVTVNENINTYIKNIRPLSKGTASSEVYLADLFLNNISLIIKFPNSPKTGDKIDFVKEYILGKSLNKLRQITPCFMYTFSLFGCDINKQYRICTADKGSPLLILEKVNGNSMTKFILESTTTFEDWLKVYVQVLLNLEIAQKLYKFNHNDLHTENVMIRTGKQPITYSFNSETKTFKVTTKSFPVLIDFGYSGMDVHGKHIKGIDLDGNAFTPEFVPCYDMYLHLARCMKIWATKKSTSTTKLQTDMNKMNKLYDFFKPGDPYRYGRQTNQDWFVNVNYSKKLLRKTPGEFLEWILSKHGNILSDTITISKRETYINPIPNNSNMYNNFYIGKYHEIIPLKTDISVITKIIEKFTTCTTEQKHLSYITSLQSLKILESMTENNTNRTVTNAKKVFTDMITNKDRKDTLIATDLVILNRFYTDAELKRTFTNINRSKLDTILNKPSTTTGDILTVDTVSDFITHMKHYYDVYLMIKELGITTEYKDWVSNFEKSDMFTYYEEVADKVDHFNRYVYTLINVVKTHLLFD